MKQGKVVFYSDRDHNLGIHNELYAINLDGSETPRYGRSDEGRGEIRRVLQPPFTSRLPLTAASLACSRNVAIGNPAKRTKEA